MMTMEANVEQFMCSYADAVHTLPSELQTHITTYLQSDLQHQHLLGLCKRYVEELKQSTVEASQKKLLHQLVMSLLAIQDICDRRIATLDEMDHLVEHHTQKLVTSRANLNTEPSQSCASGTENTVESEPDADDQTESESRNGATQPLHSRDAVPEDGTTKKPGFDDSDTESLGDVATSGFKRKVRPPLRSTSQLARSVGCSRRVLNRWDSGASRRRTAQSALSGSKKSAIQALRQRCINEQRTRDRASADRRHKLSGAYARYAGTQQQKQQKQQQQQQHQQQQRIKNQRVLSRSRPVNLFDSARRRSTNTPKETKATPAYLSTGRRLSAKLTRTSSALRMSGRSEWPTSEQYYFNDTPTDSNTRSASHVSSEDEKDDCSSAAVAAAAILSPHHSSRSLDITGWSKENEDGVEGSEEELDESDYADDDDATEGASLSMREIKPYCGKDPKSRLSSPPAASAGTSNRNQRIGVQRRRVSRLRKLADPEANYGARASSERNVVGPAQSSPSSSLEMSSVQPRGNLAATVYPLNSPMTKRRDKTAFNVSRHHPRLDTKHPARAITDETVKPLADAQKPHAPGSSAEQSSDGSASPDERLYCLCRKISFGDMIACDNKLCKVEWFHFACVDIRVQPKGKWYCPFCRGESSKVKRSDV